jgi:hypothetical protein
VPITRNKELTDRSLFGADKWATLYEIATNLDNKSKFCPVEIDAHVSWNVTSNEDKANKVNKVTRSKLSAKCPGLVFMAVQARTVQIPAADRSTLTCLVFMTNTNGRDELEPDSYQPAHFMDKASPEHSSKRPLPKQKATSQLKGQFVLQIDHGRPKKRELVLSKDYISITKDKTDSPSVNVDLCRRKENILVAFYPSTETRVPDVVGSISFFWKKGSGKTSTITAVLVHFTDTDDVKLWAAEITLLSKCNQVKSLCLKHNSGRIDDIYDFRY